jgi:C4-dicarboxylate-binding protein DctP
MEKKWISLVESFVLLALIFGFWGLAFVLVSHDAFAQQKPIVIKFAHQMPESQSVAKQARVFEKCVKEKSNGSVTVEVYPAAQLFTARDLYPAVRKGAVDMAAVVIGPIQGAIPLFEIFDVPFLFQSYDQVKKSWYGFPGEFLKKELEKQGVKFLAEGYYGFIHSSNSKREIRTPKDLQGLKIRCIGPLTADTVKAMGAGVIVMGGDEVYLAMARKVVDGSFTGTISMASRKYWEVQKYVSLIHINYTGVPMFINLELWKGLPKQIQVLLEQCAKESEDFVLKETIKDESDAVGVIKENGMKVYTPTPAEMEEFRKISLPVREDWIKKHGEIAAKMVQFVESIK